MRIIIGVTGASGIILAEQLLRALQAFPEVETHLVVSTNALLTLENELELTRDEFLSLAHTIHANENIAASIASGSFQTDGMVIIPCSMKTLAGLAHGYSDNLILRAADVCLKERRKLVLVPRESPLSSLHLENLQKVSQYGALILPPMLTFYHHPASIEDLIYPIIGKILAYFNLDYDKFIPWKGT